MTTNWCTRGNARATARRPRRERLDPRRVSPHACGSVEGAHFAAAGEHLASAAGRDRARPLIRWRSPPRPRALTAAWSGIVVGAVSSQRSAIASAGGPPHRSSGRTTRPAPGPCRFVVDADDQGRPCGRYQHKRRDEHGECHDELVQHPSRQVAPLFERRSLLGCNVTPPRAALKQQSRRSRADSNAVRQGENRRQEGKALESTGRATRAERSSGCAFSCPGSSDASSLRLDQVPG